MSSRRAVGDIATSFWARKAYQNMQSGMKKKKTTPGQTNRWKIVTGDLVEVIDGHNKGERGKVLSVIRDKHRIIVENVNVRPRHVSAYNQEVDGPSKNIVMKPCSVHYSNVALIDPSTNQPTKVARRFLEDGTKVRVSKATGVVIPKPDDIGAQRKVPRTSIVGPKDTEEDDVFAVTYDDYEKHAKAIYTRGSEVV